MAETDLESWARGEIAQAGGLMLKTESPGTRGFPDNIVFWPNGVVHLLEFKFGDGPVARLQTDLHGRIRMKGGSVFIPRDRAWITIYCRTYGRVARKPRRQPH
jgi:hypothetical protein